MPAPECTCHITRPIAVDQPGGVMHLIRCPLHEAAAGLYAALELYVAHFGDPLKVARAALLKANPQRKEDS